MKLPFFMHSHAGQTLSVGVFPTPYGSFIRSWKEGTFQVIWYPMDYAFPGGTSRSINDLGSFPDNDVSLADRAIIDFMHQHPSLCMSTAWDALVPSVTWLKWEQVATNIRCLQVPEGTYTLTISGGHAIVRFVPAGNGHELEICRLCDACDENTLMKRIAVHIDRHLSNLQNDQKAA